MNFDQSFFSYMHPVRINLDRAICHKLLIDSVDELWVAVEFRIHSSET